ncbi:MAG: penicillin acylase family protein [Gemmatimonadaceae bacterium]
MTSRLMVSGLTMIRLLIVAAAVSLPVPLCAQAVDSIRAAGLVQPVQVVRDRWGIAHISARNEHDLFFAQGYVAAEDRLFQLEVWRRQATGTVAQLLGPRELKRDIGARLFKFRGDMTTELRRYHAHGPAIVGAFVDGINAYVAETERNPALLPIEFRLLGTRPGRWTPEIVISRHQGLLGNIDEELQYGRAVAAVGPVAVRKIVPFGPGDPKLSLDPTIDPKLLSAPILELYQAFRTPIHFEPADVAVAYRGNQNEYNRLAATADSLAAELKIHERRDIGSNNWVVSGRLSESGHPIMANDPHRAQSAPSLRYWVHLKAPGWDVIGGGEPEIPGVSIGHNQYGAWGLTVFGTDGEDLYVYQTNPANPRQYRYRGAWESMRAITDTIPIKGQSPAIVALRYTRHGPVVWEDTAHHVAYAVRAAWLEPGSSPYAAILRMDQAKTWAEFRDACSYAYIPGENMVWADRAGNIGWQAIGIAPIRKNWSGLVPVPGDGRYEWAGYLPIKEKPHSFNPPSGFIATANNDLIPAGYAHMDAVGFSWADPYRWTRISEVLSAGRKLSVADMMRLQTDYLSIPARQLVPLLGHVTSSTSAVDSARKMLLAWDYVLDKSSVPAGLYEAWFRRLDENVTRVMVPEVARPILRSASTGRLVQWLTAPTSEFGANPNAGRDSLLLHSLEQAVSDLTQRFGPDPKAWVYGQEKYHHALIVHPLASAVTGDVRNKLDVGPAPRGGDGNTVGATGGSNNQTSGASFRIVSDVGDWETTMGINNPGQAGNPGDPHYRDLFSLWANDRYFPVAYAPSHVAAVTEHTTMLLPGSRR